MADINAGFAFAASVVTFFGGIYAGRKGKVDEKNCGLCKQGIEARFQSGEKKFDTIIEGQKAQGEAIAKIGTDIAVLVERIGGEKK